MRERTGLNEKLPDIIFRKISVKLCVNSPYYPLKAIHIKTYIILQDFCGLSAV